MSDIPSLQTLGPRICVLGPSNAGKSTLAARLGTHLECPVFYLDQLHHLPNTNWEPRPVEDFDRLHAEAIAQERWVIEGNYTRLFPQRAHRATGIIMLGTGRWAALVRYLRRTLFQRNRAGMLEGGIDRLNYTMLHYILIGQPPKRERDVALVRATGLPLALFETMAELNSACRAWGLQP